MGPVKPSPMDALYAERRRAYDIYSGCYVPPPPRPSGMAQGAFVAYSTKAPRTFVEEVLWGVTQSGKEVSTHAAKHYQEEMRAITILMDHAIAWPLEMDHRKHMGGEALPAERERRYQAAERYLDKKLGRISPSRLDALAQLAGAKTVEDLAEAVHLLNQCYLPQGVSQTAAALWLVGDPDEPRDTGILRWLKAETQLPLPLGVGRITPGAAALAEVLFPEKDLHIPEFVSGWGSSDPQGRDYATRTLESFVRRHRHHIHAVLRRSGHDVNSNAIALFELNLAANMAGMAAAAWAMGSASTLANATSVARTGKLVSELSLPARIGIASAELTVVEVPVFTAVSSAMMVPATGFPTLHELWEECRSALWFFSALRLGILACRFIYGFRSLPPRLESLARSFEERVLRVTGREIRPLQESIAYHGSAAGLLAEVTSFTGAVTVLSGERILKTPQIEGGLGADDPLDIFGEQALHLAILMFGGRGIHFDYLPGRTLLTRALERRAEQSATTREMEAVASLESEPLSPVAPTVIPNEATPPVESPLTHMSPRRLVDPSPTATDRMTPMREAIATGQDAVSKLKQHWRDAEGRVAGRGAVLQFVAQARKSVDAFRQFMHAHIETLQELQARTSGREYYHATRLQRQVGRWQDQITGFLDDLHSAVLQLPATERLMAEWWDVRSELQLSQGNPEAAIHPAHESTRALIRGAVLLTLQHKYKRAAAEYTEAARALFGLAQWRDGIAHIVTSAQVLRKAASHREVIAHYFKIAADLASTVDHHETMSERVWACVTVLQLRLRGLQWAVENRQLLEPGDGYSILQLKDPLADVLRLIQEDPSAFSADDFKTIIAVIDGGADRLWMTGDWDTHVLRYQKKARDRHALQLSEVNGEILTFIQDLRNVVDERRQGASTGHWSDLFTAMDLLIDRFKQRAISLLLAAPPANRNAPPRSKSGTNN